MRYFLFGLAVMLLFACSPGAAQPTPTEAPSVADAACPEIVSRAMASTDANCVQIGRNQVCYGNVRLEVTPQSGVESLNFDSPGDIIDLASLQSLNLSTMNTQTQEWGVALMAVQANLPDSLPGQNVTILLFGNVQVENAPSEDGEFAFFFQSGVGDAPCAEAPDSGILVQTPDGAGEVQFTANGVEIQLGSTAYLQAQSSADMAISVVEGAAEVTAQNITRTVSAGTRTSVPLDANRQPAGPPSPPIPYESTKLQVLPVTHLARPVGITSVLLSSTFASDAEGWTVAGDGTEIAHSAADATSDGAVCSDDTTTGEDWTFSAPESWLGDQSAAYGGSLRFVLRQSEDDAQYDSDDVALVGDEHTLTYNTDANPGTDWTAYDVPLVESAWIHASTGSAPTREEMIGVLSSLTELRIRGEYREGGDTGCLDEAQLVGIVMPVVEGSVVQIEPTPRSTPERSVAGQVSEQATPTSTAVAPTGAQIGFEVADALTTAGERKPYTFTAEPGHIVYFDSLSGTAMLRARVTDDTGAEIMPEWWLDRDAGLVTLEQGGTYTITVAGYQDATGEYSFKLWDVPAPERFTFAIDDIVSDGAPSAGAANIESPGAQDIYTFEAEAGQQVYLDGLAGTAMLRAHLTDAAGEEVTSEWWFDRDGGLVTLERGGAYTLTAFGYAEATGAYSFKLWDVPAPETFTFAIGDTVSDGVPSAGAGNIESPGAQDSFTFEAEAGQQVYLDGLAGTAMLRAHLTDAAGEEVTSEWWFDRDGGLVTLERGGAYTLTAFGYAEATGAYSFKLWDVPAPETFTFAIGDTVSDGVPSAGAGNIESPGARDIYTFEAEAGQSVFFDGLAGTALLRAHLTDDTGAEVTSEWWFDRDNGEVVLERGGTYTLTAYGYAAATGAYSFKLWDVTEAQVVEIQVGDVVADGVPAPGAGNIESPGSEDSYTFSAEPGQVILFDGQGGSAVIRATLTDEAGTPVFEDEWMDRAAALRTLERGGIYTLRVFAVDASTGPYAFQIWDVPAPDTFEIAIGDVVSDGVPGAGSIETPGVRDVYTLAAEAGQVVMFDAQGGSAYIRATMTDEDGTLIFEDEWTDRAAAQRALELGGTYTITVFGVDDTVGTYSFQVWDVPPPQEFEIAIGDSVAEDAPGEGAGNIETPGVYDVYTFTATPGQVIALEGQPSNGNLLWTLLDETGEEVFENRPLVSATGPVTLTRGGIYTLRVFGNLDAVGTYEFAFVAS